MEWGFEWIMVIRRDWLLLILNYLYWLCSYQCCFFVVALKCVCLGTCVGNSRIQWPRGNKHPFINASYSITTILCKEYKDLICGYKIKIKKRLKYIIANENNHSILCRKYFQLLIKPWIRINGSLNRRVIDRWLSVILSYCISNPGVTIQRLALRFNLLVPIHIRELAEHMERLDLVSLRAMRTSGAPVYLWTTYRHPIIGNLYLCFINDNQTHTKFLFVLSAKATKLDSMDTVFIDVRPNAVTRLGLFIGDKQYKMEFL